MEIEVIENGEESVRYIVNDNMLVEQLKLEIMKKRNIKPKNQLLTDSTGKVMEDKETTLWEYNIREPLSLFFSIDMEDKHINVKINGNIIDYTYTDTDTIYDLKCKIFRREGTGIHGIRLVVGRNTLQDEELIQNYHGQTITFVLRSLDPYRRYYTVRYEDNHGNAKSFVIPDSQTELTIQMVKEKIGTALGIPFNNQVLKHGNIVLRNNEVLGNKFVLALEVVNQGGRKTRRRRGRRRQKTRSRK